MATRQFNISVLVFVLDIRSSQKIVVLNIFIYQILKCRTNAAGKSGVCNYYYFVPSIEASLKALEKTFFCKLKR